MKINVTLRALVLPAAILALAGCASSNAKSTDSLSVPPAGHSSASASPKDDTMRAGQEAVVNDHNDELAYRFKVDSASAVTECPNHPDFQNDPQIGIKNGHLVQMKIEEQVGNIEASKDPYIAQMSSFGGGINQSSWTFVGPNGTRANEIATPITYNCLRTTQTLPSSLNSNEQATGLMLLDLPATKGKLKYTDAYTGKTFIWNLVDLIGTPA